MKLTVQATFTEKSEFEGKDGKVLKYVRGFIKFPNDEFPRQIGLIGDYPLNQKGTLDLELDVRKEKLQAKVVQGSFKA